MHQTSKKHYRVTHYTLKPRAGLLHHHIRMSFTSNMLFLVTHHWLNICNTTTGHCCTQYAQYDMRYSMHGHFPLIVNSCTEQHVTHRQAHGDSRAVQPLHVLHRAEQSCLAIHSKKRLHTFKELYEHTKHHC